MDDERELCTVLARYELGEVRSCQRLDSGYVNETWIVETTSGVCIVRRRDPSLAQPSLVEAQHALIRHLNSAGFPAPGIYCDRRGATFVLLRGRLYEVHQYLGGVLCDVSRPAHTTAAAQVLGWYHRAVTGFDRPALHRIVERYGPSVLGCAIRRLMDEWCGKVSPGVRGMCQALRAHVTDLETSLGALGDLPRLIIHGDYYAENLIMRDDKVLGVIDYDQAHWCQRVLEVAEALIYFAREAERRLEHIVYSGALDLAVVERFLATYCSVGCLSDAEICALPDFLRMIWMCASLDPPLRARPTVRDALQVLPEVLYLADWAQAHAEEVIEIGFAARGRRWQREWRL